MKKDISKVNGTIAKHLCDHKDEIWACDPNINAMRSVALKLLDDPCLTDKEAVAQAKHIFKTAGNNLFLSCLLTYMTGVKVN